MKSAMTVTGLLCAVTLTGCVSSQPLTLSGSAATALGVGPGTGDQPVGIDEVIAGLAAQTDNDKRVGAVIALIARSDEICERHMERSIVRANTSGSLLGLGNLAFTALATSLKPLDTSQALASTAGFAAGTESYLTKKVLGGSSPGLIYDAVMAERKKERARLTESLVLGANPLIVASELTNYHGMCGVTVGVNALGTAVQRADASAVGDGQAKAVEEVTTLNEAKAERQRFLPEAAR